MKAIIYSALKPCKFAGQAFRIGNRIPDGLIRKEAAPRLIKMGVIAAVEGEIEEPSSLEGERGVEEDDAPEEGGPLLPPSSTLEKSDLLKMTKAKLLEVAAEKGVAASDSMTKEDIADLIIEEQGE